jgi:DNA-binding GntR family transcriptional regulator
VPQPERPPPLYVQLANHYRALILSGELPPGAQLPSVLTLAKDWGVSSATAAKAIGQLQVEGAVWTSPQGTFAAGNDVIAPTARERLDMARSASQLTGETVVVTGAAIQVPPVYVSELLGITPGGLVIRREEVGSQENRPVRLTVDWIPGMGQMDAGSLLAPLPVAGGVLAFIERATRRRATYVEEHLRGRAADGREADHLRLRIGSPILAPVAIFSDDDGPLLYTESCYPPDRVVSYRYSLGEPAEG